MKTSELQIYDIHSITYGYPVKFVYLEYTSFKAPEDNYKGKAKVINVNLDNMTVRPVNMPTFYITIDYDDCENKELKVSNSAEKIAIYKLKK